MLDNAVKYSPKKIDICVSATADRDQILVRVSDQGIGLSKEDHSFIFNKFERGSAAKQTQARGTGLGLAMVRNIVEENGGSIIVSNNSGKGVTFTMSLKAAEFS